MFKQKFGNDVVDGDSISCEIDGITYVATVNRDQDNPAPWKSEDGHGPVFQSASDTTGAWVLSKGRGSSLFYDHAEARKIARKDGWGPPGGPKPGESREEQIERAVANDFQYLKGWCDGDWMYFIVSVTARFQGIELLKPFNHCQGGIEGNAPGSDHAYMTQVANDLLGEARKEAVKSLASLAAKLREAHERIPGLMMQFTDAIGVLQGARTHLKEIEAAMEEGRHEDALAASTAVQEAIKAAVSLVRPDDPVVREVVALIDEAKLVTRRFTDGDGTALGPLGI
jgi:hypothetical protein